MNILHLEDDSQHAALVREMLVLEWPGCTVTCVQTRQDFASELVPGRHDLILSDYTLPGFNGHEALRLARERVPDLPFVFLSGTIGEDTAVQLVQEGAADYLLKDRMQRLPIAILRALQDTEDRRHRRQDEARVRELIGLLNQARDAVIVAGIDDRITFWNQGAERMFGWSAAEAIGRTGADLLGPVQAGLSPAMHELVEPTGEWHGEVRLGHKEGHRVVADLRVTLIRDEAGRARSRLSIITDITEKKDLEEQLLRAQRLESLGMLAAGIAHDLNNVLAPVLMGAPLLRSRATHPADIRVIETIELSAVRGAALVRQVLAFAHGAGGEKTLIQVRHLLRDIRNLFTETFPKSIQLELACPNDLWPVLGNPTQLHQVLLNLCLNARDAMPHGGTLQLAAANRELDATAASLGPDSHPGSYIMIEITDNGTGIPPEALSRIWEPFFTTKGEGKGTGLGLATVRGIVVNHGGFATVESDRGRGTTFRIFIPASKESTPDELTARSQLASTHRGKGELLLVVDDEKNIRDLIATILGRNGYRVLAARDGHEALALFKLRAHDFRLVITDLHMPGLDGSGLVDELRRVNPAVRILMMSGAENKRASTPAIPTAVRILKKPFTGEELLAHVYEHLE